MVFSLNFCDHFYNIKKINPFFPRISLFRLNFESTSPGTACQGKPRQLFISSFTFCFAGGFFLGGGGGWVDKTQRLS